MPNPDNRPLTDQELVTRFRAGDEEASSELYRRFEKKVFDRALKKLGDRDAAESVRQQTFIKVFDKIDQYQGESSVSAWIMRVLASTSTDYLRRPETRRRRRGETIPLKGSSTENTWDILLRRPGIQAQDESASPLENTLSGERVALVNKAIALLKPESQRCIQLFHLEHMSCEEIAAELGVPLKTVETRLSRARKQLSAALKKLRNR